MPPTRQLRWKVIGGLGGGFGSGGAAAPREPLGGGGVHATSSFHPVDVETPSTTSINLEMVDTSQKVGATSPGP